MHRDGFRLRFGLRFGCRLRLWLWLSLNRLGGGSLLLDGLPLARGLRFLGCRRLVNRSGLGFGDRLGHRSRCRCGFRTSSQLFEPAPEPPQAREDRDHEDDRQGEERQDAELENVFIDGHVSP